MIIKTTIELELDRITIEETLANEKGKFACFNFRMSYPSAHYFFGQRKGVSDKPFTIVWGNSPSISYYSKDYKPLQKMVMRLIEEDLGLESGWGIVNWSIAFTGTSTQSNRDWGIYYHASKYLAHGDWREKDGRILLNPNFMARVIAELPNMEDVICEI